MELGTEAVIGSGAHNGSYVEFVSGNGVIGKSKFEASILTADGAGALTNSSKCTSSGISAFESPVAGAGSAGTFCSVSVVASSF